MHHCFSRAGIDPIRHPDQALTLLVSMSDDPPIDETIVLVLDAARRGRSIVKVTGTSDPDSLLGVVDVMAESAPDAGALVIASIRPSGGLDRHDVDRWLDADATCSEYGVDLVEWFVVGRTTTCPRLLCDPRPRWAA